VSVRTALASSLNVPAVRTLQLIGVERFRDRLHELGYAGINQSSEFYGYSLALGSAEVSLWQQVQAYRALARGGELSALSLLPGVKLPSERLLPAAASFIVSDVLSDPAARAVSFGLGSHLETGFWTAVKTGTSEDMRDNWCIGFSQHLTVGVWVGNFEGDSMRQVSGISGAAPIWHDLMQALDVAAGAPEPAAPAGVHAAGTQFAQSVEPPRREWYLEEGAGLRTVAPVPQAALPRIASPVDGTVIALDPDIPAAHQRVLISLEGAGPSMQLSLNDTRLGGAVSEQLWTPRPGHYRLQLEDADGHVLDRILFTVRGAPD
jgi:penicillin-binding protein 1C